MSGSTRGFGGFGRQSLSPQEQKYLSFSRSGVRASGGGAGKRSSRRSLSTSSVNAALAAASASHTGSISTIETTTPASASQRTHYVMRTSGKKSHSKKHIRVSDTMTDASVSMEGSTASTSALGDTESAVDSTVPMSSDSAVDVETQNKIAELEHALEEANKAREEAVALAAERQTQLEALQAEAESLRQRYFNALCLAVKLDTLQGDDKKQGSSKQKQLADSQQELYDLAKQQNVPVEEYPMWVASNISKNVN